MISYTKLGHLRWGRLGNQMFEYATLLGVGMRLGYEVAVPPPEDHSLSTCFDISAPVLTESDREQLRHVFHESHLGYSERIWSIEDFTDLRGFFQSEHYFPPREVVKAEFTFKPELTQAAQELLQPWRKQGRVIVGMSVRRGDYQHFPEKYVQLFDTDFYDRAVAEFEDLDPIVIVSSNEPDWCRQRYTGDRFAFADSISDTAQLAMLTQCEHLIVANSSFAWWGAWLNDGPGRRIAPSRWMTLEVRESQRDPLPEGWETLEV
jgi:Glycosyl transferase family 11